MGDQRTVSSPTDSFDLETLAGFRQVESNLLESRDWQGLYALYAQHASEFGEEEVSLTELVDHLNHLVDEVEDESEAAEIQIALGDLYAEHLDRRKDAKQTYRSAFVTDTTNTRSLERARSLYREEGNYQLVTKLYDLEQQVTSEPEHQASVLFGKAQAQGDFLGAHDEALQNLKRARELDPENELIEEVVEIYSSGGTVESTVDDTYRLAEDARTGGDGELAGRLYYKAGRLEAYREGGDRTRAAQLLSQAAELNDHDEEAVLVLQDLGMDVGELGLEGSEAAADDLEGAELDEAELDEAGPEVDEKAQEEAEEEEPDEELAEGSEAEAETTEGEGGDEQAAAVETEAGDNELPEPAEAAGPGETIMGTGAVQAVGGDEDSESEESADDEVVAGDVETFYASVPDYDGSLEEARETLADDPANLSALKAVRGGLLADEELEELAERLEGAVKRRRKKRGETELMAELANLYWERIGDIEQAEYYFKRLKVLEADHPDVLGFYESYFTREEDWRRLFSHLKKWEDKVEDDEERRRLVARRAEIAEQEMDSPAKAIDVWKHHLRQHDHAHGRRELRRLYEQYEKWTGLVDFLKEEVKRLEQQEEDTREGQIELLERMVDLYEDEIGHQVMATNTLREILEIKPDHRGAFERLRDKLASNRRWNDLAALLEERAERLVELEEPKEASELLARVAEIYDEEMKHTSRAVPFFERVVELAPEHERSRTRLADIYETRKDWESLFELRQRELDFKDGTERFEQLQEMLGLVREQLGDHQRAIPILEELLDWDPADLERLEDLEEGYRQADENEKLADLLERKAELADDEETRAEALAEAASLQQESFENPDAAMELWERVRAIYPEHGDAVGQLTDLYLQGERWDALERMYADLGRHDRLFDLFDSAAEMQKEVEAKRELYERMAGLAEETLDDVERVIISLESLLEVGEDPRAIAGRLADWYHRAGEFASEIEMLERVLGEAEEGEVPGLLRRLVDLEAERGEFEAALERQIQVLGEEPEAEGGLERAEDLAREAGSFERLVESLDLLVEGVESEVRQVEMLRLLARLERVELERPEAAADHLEMLLALESEDEEALANLADLYETDQRWAEFVEVGERLVDLRRETGAPQDEILEPLQRIARVRHREMDAVEQAREDFEEILQLDPDWLPAVRGLADIARRQEAWDDVVDALQRQLSLVELDDEEARIEVQYELAEVFRDHQQEYGEALHYYRQVLDDRPGHEGAIEAVQTLLAVDEQARPAALLLEPIFRESEQWLELAEAVEARREAVEDPYEEFEALDELIDLYANRLEAPDEAYDRSVRQFELSPEREDVWSRLEELGGELERLDEVEGLYVEALEGEAADLGPDAEEGLLAQLAHLRRDRLEKPEKAAEAFERLWELSGEDSAGEALEALYRQLDRFEDLVDVLERRAEATLEEEAKIDFLQQAGTIWEDILDEPQGAIECRRSILEAAPTHDESIEGLTRLYRRTERWPSLEELYEQRIEQSYEPEERRDLQIALAKLRSDKLEDFIGAEGILTDLIRENPNDDAVLEAIEELEVALIKSGGAHFDLRVDIARALEPVYRERGDASRLVDVLSVRLRNTDADLERVDLLDELARLNDEQLDQPETAFRHLVEAVPLDPDDEGRRERLEKTGRRLEKLDEVVDTLEEAAEGADPYTEAAIAKRVGELCHREIERPEEAIVAFEMVLDYDESDAEALEALEELFESLERPEDLAGVLDQQVRYGAPEKRGEHLSRLGRLEREVLGRPREAIQAYRRLSEVEPESLEALEALGDLYEARTDWVELSEVLRRRADIVADVEERIDVLEELASVYDEQLHDVDEAIAVYEEVLSADPTRVATLDALEQRFRRTERWADVADVLRKRLVTEEGDEIERRTEIEVELAEVLRNKLYETEQAIEIYRVVLGRVPGHEDAMAALEALVEDPGYAAEVADDLVEQYREQEAWQKLVDLYEMRVDQEADPERRADLYLKAAEVYRDGLSQTELAMDALAEAWRLRPDDEEARSTLEDIAKAKGEWGQLAYVYGEVMPEVAEPERRVELHLRLAELQRDRLEDPVAAEDHFREALNTDPRAWTAYDALEALLVEGERWLDLVELLERKLDVVKVEDAEQVRGLLARIAEVQEERVEDEFAAAEVWERLLNVAPEDAEAVEALGRLYRQQQRWEDLAGLLERRLEQVSQEAEVVAVAFELAEVSRLELFEAERAVDLYREVLEHAPQHDGSVEALEALFDEREGVREQAADLLEGAFLNGERWEALADLKVRRAEFVDDGEQRAELLRQAVDLAVDQLEDPERAFTVSCEWMVTAPADEAARDQTRGLAEIVDRWTELVDTYDRALSEGLEFDGETRTDLLVEQGALLEERVGDLEEARRVYEEALLERPAESTAVRGLERLLHRAEDWEAISALYHDQIGGTEETLERREWMVKSARLDEVVRDRPESAVETWLEVLRDFPGDDEARTAVERLFGKQGRWWDLVDLYRDQIEESEDENEAVELKLRLAQTLENELGEMEQAIQAYGDILETQPGHRGTMRALEGLRRELAERRESWRDLRLMIIEKLPGQYDEQTDWRRIVELLAEKRGLIQGMRHRADLLLEEAELFEAHGLDGVERARGLERVARAFCLYPEDEEIAERMERLAEQLDAWRMLPKALLEGLEVTEAPEQRARVFETMGRVYQDRLEAPDSAIVAFQSSVDAVPRDEALERLEALLRERQLWERLVGVLEKRSERVEEPEERLRLLKRLGSLYDDVLERPSEAAPYYEELLELEPEQREHYDALELIYERTGQYEPLERLLQSRLEMAESAEERERVLRRLATIQDEYLEKAEAAIDTYRSLHAGDGNDRQVVEALSRLYEQTKRWPELLQILGLERDFADSLDEVNRIDFRRGQLQLEKLNDPTDAFVSFRTVLERDGEFDAAREAIEGLVEEAETRREAAEYLQEFYRDREDWSALEDLYDRLLEREEDEERRGELYVELAQVHEEYRDRPQLAFAMLGRAVRELPAKTYLRRELERVSRKLGAPDELVAVYEDTLEGGDLEREVERRLRLEVAETAVDELEALDVAIDHVQVVLEDDAYDAEALDLLDTFYQKRGAWAELEEVLERRLTVADADEETDIRFRLGYLQEAILDDPISGLDQYREVLRQEPGHRGAIGGLERLVENQQLRREICDLLEPIYEEEESWGKLIQLLRLRLEVVDDDHERAELNRRIAHFEMEERGNPELGYAFLGRSLRADPHGEAAQEELEALAEEHGFHAELVALYEDILDSITDPIRVVELAERAAEWANDPLEEPDRAADLYWVILDIEPEHEAALDGLESIAREQGRSGELADVLKRKVDVIFDPDEQRELYLELGEIRLQLEQFAQAADAYRAALLLDESDTEVMEKLVGLYEVIEEYDELVEILDRLTNFVQDNDELVRLNIQIAQYSKVFLEDEERAIDAYRKVLQHEPGNERALEELEELYEAQERWSNLRDTLVQAYDVAEQDEATEELVRTAVKLGELAFEQFGDRHEAMEWYQKALERRPDSPVVVEALDGLYRSEERWDDLVGLYESQLERADGDERRAELYVDLAEVALEELGDDAKAGTYLDEAFDLASDSDRVLQLDGKLCRREENWEGLVDVLDRRLELIEDSEVEVAIRLERAELLEKQFAQSTEAAADYRAVLEKQPLNEEALEALDRIYRQNENFHALFDVLKHEAEHVDSEARALGLYEELADLAEGRMESPELAIEALESAYRLQPGELDVAEALIRKYIDVGRLDEARPVLQDLVGRLEEDGEKEDIVRFEHLRGELAEKQGDYDTALECYEAVHRRDDEYIPNLLSLGKLAYRRGDWDEAKNTFQKLLLHQMKLKSDAQKVEVYYYLGLIRKEMGDGRRAKDMFNRALSIDPEHQPSRDAIAEL